MSDVPQNSSDDAASVIVGAGETAISPGVASDSAVVSMTSVGRKLHAAREAAHLSLTEVAQSLKFSPRQIELLEADDLAGLPGTTVIRGFIRSYAKLLRLDPEALLRMLDESSPSAPVEVRPPDNMGVASQPGVLQQLSFGAAAAIVLVMAGILLGLWHFLGPSATRPAAPQTRSESPVQPLSPFPPGGSPSSLEPQLAAATPPLPGAAGVADTAAVAQPQTDAQAAPAANELNFTFNDRAWVEVVDASKKMLHSGENFAGSRLKVTGRPPFELVIGNASKVTLTYGERVIDLAPYMRADVARLTLQ